MLGQVVHKLCTTYVLGYDNKGQPQFGYPSKARQGGSSLRPILATSWARIFILYVPAMRCGHCLRPWSMLDNFFARWSSRVSRRERTHAALPRSQNRGSFLASNGKDKKSVYSIIKPQEPPDDPSSLFRSGCPVRHKSSFR